jgi:hypothetical protein
VATVVGLVQAVLRPDGLVDPKAMVKAVIQYGQRRYHAGYVYGLKRARREQRDAEKPREVGRELEASSWARPEAG